MVTTTSAHHQTNEAGVKPASVSTNIPSHLFSKGLHFGFGHRLPSILQTEAAECGLACLAMIASYHGHNDDLTSLRRRFGLSLKGATLGNVIQFAQTLGFATRPLRLDLDNLQDLQLPCILHWDLNHFVVLREVKRKQITIHDPARGEQQLSLETFSQHFTGIALELTPSEGFVTKKAEKKPSLFALMGRITGLKRSAAQVLMFAIALEILALMSPFFMQWVVDGALVSADVNLLTTLALGFGLLLIFRECISVARAWLVTVLSTTLNLQWLGNVFQHLLKLPVSWFEKRHLGDVVSRFESIHTLQRTLTTNFLEGAIDGVMAIVTLVMMCVYSVTLAGIVLGAMLLYSLVRLVVYYPLRNATQEHIIAQAKTHSHFLETVRGISSLKLFNRLGERSTRHLNLVVDTMNRQVTTQKLALLWRMSNAVLFGLTGILIVYLGGRAVLEGAFSVGMLFAFVAYKDQFVQRVTSLIDKIFEWRMMRLHGDRLADIVTAEPEATNGELNLTQASNDDLPSLEVQDLHFRYASTEPWVLTGVNFKVEPGEAVAIVGASGCGKSTLGKILLGLLPAEQGKILYAGKDLNRIGLRAYRDAVGTVMQDDQLFAGSIADNIAFFDHHVDTSWLEECAKTASIHADIEAMPMQYNTLIGDMGTSLSGGQKQRILLARALYKRPKILFLDEATSALDVHNEKLVNAAIQKLQLTRVIIAHRPETIAMADRVIVLKGGQVAQEMRSMPTGELLKVA